MQGLLLKENLALTANVMAPLVSAPQETFTLRVGKGNWVGTRRVWAPGAWALCVGLGSEAIGNI